MSDAPRRAHGNLEAMILRCVWAAGRPVSPADVLESIDADIAYTTAMTVLTRLWEKGLLKRERDGRRYRYQPAIAESALAADRMEATLRAASDRGEVLMHFVGSLKPEEADALRRLLGTDAESAG